MEKTTWKIIAIVIIALFIIENISIVYLVFSVLKEEKKDLSCYYETCQDYPEAVREGNLCYCYDYDVIGNLEIVKTTIVN